MHNEKLVTYKRWTRLPSVLLVDDSFDPSLATASLIVNLVSTAYLKGPIAAAVNTS